MKIYNSRTGHWEEDERPALVETNGHQWISASQYLDTMRCKHCDIVAHVTSINEIGTCARGTAVALKQLLRAKL